MKWFNLSDNVNSLSLLGAALIILLTLFVVGKYFKQMKEKKGDVELTGEEWDGIGEQTNEIPVGWSVTFILLIVWAIWYFFIGYPLNSFSQVGMYNEEVKAHNAKFEAKFANPDKATLLAMGEGIYLVQCSQCHGISGDGINGKSRDLTKWGNEAGLVDIIKHGSKGLEYPLGEMTPGLVEDKDIVAVAAFVASEVSAIKATKNPHLVEQGREAYAICTSCHGMDGKGMDGNAPDITKYGTSDFVVDVLNRGKHGYIGQMPSFTDGRLSDTQKRAVGEYITSLAK